MNKIENQIHFEQLGLGSILKRYQLNVPPNQREYSWTDKEVTALLQDFSQAISEDESGYFLGTVVTISKTETNSLEVTDGQQRLATTVILLTCIYHYLKPIEPELAASIRTEFLMGYDRTKRQQVPKMSLNLRDNDFFRAKVTGEMNAVANCESHDRIAAAFTLCTEHISNVVSLFSERDKGDALNKWVSFIQDKALVVLVRVTDAANAYKMFETLNDRGLKTSQSDLVKNYLFGKAGERLAEVQEKWALLRGTLESLENEDITIDFLRHALIATQDFVREQQVYEAVQRVAKTAQTAITFVGNMEILANIYVAIHNKDHDKWNRYSDSVRRSIDVLNLFNFKPMRPLMLAIAAKFNEKETQAAFKFLITLTVRIFISGNSRSGSIEQAFATTAREVYSGKLKLDFKNNLKSITPSNEQFKIAFENASVSKMQWARYYLRSLEMTAKNESEPWLIPNDDKQAINLEHILPKKPESNWPEFTEDEVGLYVNRLGNLALLQASKNSDLKTDSFDKKKQVYQSSPYALTSQIAGEAKWGKNSIIARQKTMADYALIAWGI